MNMIATDPQLLAVPHPARKPSRSKPALSESLAAEAMWQYYKAHRSELIGKIKEFRSIILAQLMAGVPAEQVFEPYRLKTNPGNNGR